MNWPVASCGCDTGNTNRLKVYWNRFKLPIQRPSRTFIFFLRKREWNFDQGKKIPVYYNFGSHEHHRMCKGGCVFLMVVVAMLFHVEIGRNDHREDAPHFIWPERTKNCHPYLSVIDGNSVRYYSWNDLRCRLELYFDSKIAFISWLDNKKRLKWLRWVPFEL